MNNIALVNLHFQTPIPNKKTTLKFKCFKPKTPISSSTTIPARDRVIDFGKHKGKMLGTLPSSYLKWVSKTLRARDFEDWAKLADHVLQDPVYQDRLEWEFAQNVLDGNRTASSSSSSSAVSDLLDISARFGWDNEDKVGWSKVNFEFLGTSKSGRIPRVWGGEKKDGGKRVELEGKGGKVEGESGGRRSERRERVRLRMKMVKRVEEDKLGIVDKGRGNMGDVNVDNDHGINRNEVGVQKKKEMGEIYSPFPGREALLKNVIRQGRFS